MRIAIVNDQEIAIEILRRIVMSVPEYEIIWTARNGAEAVGKCLEDVPDVILMNLIMPVMNGVEATRLIMKNSPCSILLVTSTVESNRSKIFEAMGQGALDVVATPSIDTNGKIKGADVLLGKINTIGKLTGKSRNNKRRTSSIQKGIIPPLTHVPRLVIIGSSTGGPKALEDILSQLPENFGAAIAIVQHVNAEYTSGLVDWLDSKTPLDVSLAVDGKQLAAGKVLVAGTNDHIIMNPDLTLAYTSEPRDYHYRPSVDIFFKSVAKNWREKAAAVLLTGMGSDGAEGLKLLRGKGWYTIAQDRETSVVYGMPKAAAEIEAAVDILPIDKIAPALVRHINKKP